MCCSLRAPLSGKLKWENADCPAQHARNTAMQAWLLGWRLLHINKVYCVALAFGRLEALWADSFGHCQRTAGGKHKQRIRERSRKANWADRSMYACAVLDRQAGKMKNPRYRTHGALFEVAKNRSRPAQITRKALIIFVAERTANKDSNEWWTKVVAGGVGELWKVKVEGWNFEKVSKSNILCGEFFSSRRRRRLLKSER